MKSGEFAIIKNVTPVAYALAGLAFDTKFDDYLRARFSGPLAALSTDSAR